MLGNPHHNLTGNPTGKSSALINGSAKFTDSRLAGVAAKEGALAAWRDAVNRDATKAAAGVTGDFAVGLIDEQGRGFVAVDRFSIQPLCYRVVDGQLRFAARADELADASTEIDPQAIFDYLYFHVIPSPRTIYKGIFRMPAGHFGWFENGRSVSNRIGRPVSKKWPIPRSTR